MPDMPPPPAASGCRASRVRGDSGSAGRREDTLARSVRDSDFVPQKIGGLWPRAKSAGGKLRPASALRRAALGDLSERAAGGRVRPRSKISGAAGSRTAATGRRARRCRPRPRTSGISAPSRILSSFRPSSATRGCGVFRASGSRGGRPRRAAGVGRGAAGALRSPRRRTWAPRAAQGHQWRTRFIEEVAAHADRARVGRHRIQWRQRRDAALDGRQRVKSFWRGVLSDGTEQRWAAGRPAWPPLPPPRLAQGLQEPRAVEGPAAVHPARSPSAGRLVEGLVGRASAHSGKELCLGWRWRRPKGCNSSRWRTCCVAAACLDDAQHSPQYFSLCSSEEPELVWQLMVNIGGRNPGGSKPRKNLACSRPRSGPTTASA